MVHSFCLINKVLIQNLMDCLITFRKKELIEVNCLLVKGRFSNLLAMSSAAKNVQFAPGVVLENYHGVVQGYCVSPRMLKGWSQDFQDNVPNFCAVFALLNTTFVLLYLSKLLHSLQSIGNFDCIMIKKSICYKATVGCVQSLHPQLFQGNFLGDCGKCRSAVREFKSSSAKYLLHPLFITVKVSLVVWSHPASTPTSCWGVLVQDAKTLS